MQIMLCPQYKVVDPEGSARHFLQHSLNILPKLSWGKEVVRPLFNVIDGDVKAGRDDPAFVETACQIHYNFASSVVVDNLELSNITC
jgi:hypothetical protein